MSPRTLRNRNPNPTRGVETARLPNVNRAWSSIFDFVIFVKWKVKFQYRSPARCLAPRNWCRETGLDMLKRCRRFDTAVRPDIDWPR